MKKRFDIATVFALMLLVGITTWLFTFMAAKNQFESQLSTDSQIRNELNIFLQAKKIIEDYYVGDWSERHMQEGAVAGMVYSLGDRWSHYLTEEEYNIYMNRDQITGIGISVVPHDDGLLVNEVYQDSPAAECGIEPFDIITAIDGRAYADIESFHAAADLIRGQSGESVTLTLHRDGRGAFTATMMRRVVPIDNIRASVLDGNIGSVRIRNFNKGAFADFNEALNNLIEVGVAGLIIDVRNNPGGELDTMCDMLDLLLPEGEIIIVRDKAGIEHPYMSDAQYIDLPIVVLCNENSFSAAEFFAAALQEYGRAFVVGEQTLGKSYAQHTYLLDDNSALILSIDEYLTPIKKLKLSDTNGLAPDRTVALDPSLTYMLPLADDEQDTQLQAGLAELHRRIPQTPSEPEEED